MDARPNPVIFIHGLWIHTSAWQPWVDLFNASGYDSSAPGWPGDGATVEDTRANSDSLNDVGIEDLFRHYATIIEGLDETPVVIGHGFGGLVAQELLAKNLAVAAVAIDPLPIKGVRAVPYSQLKSTLPVLGNPKNKKRTVSLTARQFQYSFGNAIDEAESNELFEKWNIPGPGRPLFEDATSALSRNSPAAVDTQTAVRGPLLLTAGLEDHMVPPIVTQQVFSLYRESSSRTDYRQFPGRGHSLTIDHGWQEVAQSTIDWLTEQGF